MTKLITRALLFTRSMYLIEMGVPVQTLIPQARILTVASVVPKHPWSYLSFAAFCACKSIHNDI